MAKHSGIKYKCKLCGKNSYIFDRTDVLKHHYLTVHEKTYYNHNMYEICNDSNVSTEADETDTEDDQEI